jgi:hypothetical protein
MRMTSGNVATNRILVILLHPADTEGKCEQADIVAHR